MADHEHLAFGWGIHRCVAMPLAQLELRVAVEEILAASDWITLISEIEWISLIDPRHIRCRLDAGASRSR
jgi:cytochrome P450